MTEKKEAALAKIEEYAIVAMGDSIADIMAENLGDDGLSEFSLAQTPPRPSREWW